MSAFRQGGAVHGHGAERDGLSPASIATEAEQSVLGAMMLDPASARRAVELLEDSTFSLETHRRLFRAMVALTQQGGVIDHVTLQDELVRRGELELVGGMEYLGELADAVVTPANLEHHAKIVRRTAHGREVRVLASRVVQDPFGTEAAR